LPLPGGIPDSIAGLIQWSVSRFGPEHQVIEDGEGAVTLGQLQENVERGALALARMGVCEGDRVAASLPNGRTILELFLSAQVCKAIWVGVNQALAAPEKADMIADCEPTVFLGAGTDGSTEIDSWLRLRSGSAAGPTSEFGLARGDVAGVIAYTSGTTGRPKGVVHTQHNLIVPAASFAWSGRYRRGSRIGVAYPLTIINMIIQSLLAALCAGATCCVLSRRDAAGMLAEISTHDVETISVVPATAYDMVQHHSALAATTRSLKRVLIGAGYLNGQVARDLGVVFGVEVEHGYGLTEAPGLVTSGRLEDRLTAGRPLAHVSVQVCSAMATCPTDEAGEIVLGPADEGPWAGVWTPPLGYWDRPIRRFDRDGRIWTGDFGAFDSDRRLTILDRRTEILIRGGSNVYPTEIEKALFDHDSVRSVVVVGRPDLRLGQIPVALVEVEGDGVTGSELTDYCRARLAHYKVPEVLLVDEIRRNALGKPDRAWARELAGINVPKDEGEQL
jgi:long-chain acyl-CoA synthetase